MIWNGTWGSLEDEDELKYEPPDEEAGERGELGVLGVLGVEHLDEVGCVASGMASMVGCFVC